jgi:hypothetical protein
LEPPPKHGPERSPVKALIWLANCHGEHSRAVNIWQAYFAPDIGTVIEDPQQVRAWSHRFAKSAGPSSAGFTANGFSDYLDTLMQNDAR